MTKIRILLIVILFKNSINLLLTFAACVVKPKSYHVFADYFQITGPLTLEKRCSPSISFWSDTGGVYIPKERRRMTGECVHNTSCSQPGKSGYVGAAKQRAKFNLYLKSDEVLVT